MLDDLDLAPEALAAAASQIAAMLSEHRAGGGVDPLLVVPHPDPETLRAGLRSPLPSEGTSLARLLDECRERLLPFGRRNDSPRFFGYVCSGGSDAGALADFLASGINQNVTA